ncbi:proton-coupled folate transporter-like [Tetranychus urticae]|uniref:Major facilitator superfamily (MFS) profile domain-containing protein n=1 Tax=Tetranychus urticae TaxID=32264 RepID=T1KTH1_TETUR|nr:proton-coupled folate transporter-like [Tetranychus urticae]
MAAITSTEVWEIVKLLRIDVFYFLATLSTLLPEIALNQLIQDKYCINKYSLNESVCLNLETAGPAYDRVRNDVLKDTTTLKMHFTLMTTIPAIILSLILGYWMDKYPGHLRYLAGVASLAVICQNVMIIIQCLHFEMDADSLLWTYLVPVFTGSSIIISIGTFTYATRKTPAKFRAVRFTIIEICLFAAMPIASLLGGGLLASKPWFPNQHRNYIGVYIISSVSAAIAAIWVVLLLYDAADEEVKTNESQPKGDASSCEKTKTMKQIIYDIIKPDNIVHASRTVFKRRPNNAHWYLISTILAGIISNICNSSEQYIGYQFSQKVYHWSAKQIGTYNSIIVIFPALGALIGPPLFIHKMNLHDTSLSIIALVSIMLSFLVKGFILNPIVYFFGIFGCFASVIFVADRSIISRMIHKDEIGQVYAFSSAIAGFVPTIASLFYTKVFTATLDYNPGLVYIITGLLFIIPLSNSILLNIKKQKWDLVLIAEKEKETQEIKVELKS